MCAAAARRAAILRVREPGCALACRATVGTTFTLTYLDTDWRAPETKRPSAVGLSDFSPTQLVEPDSIVQSKNDFSVLLKAVTEKGADNWRASPHHA
ncbi:unnamed protein product [Euphydryas editha]|uniref:Uncharacterized protein n=1 Tax=Euphydryas editha TaxID=104508 RepID=A0AAU9UYA1_EUPED|nr:unnamed protein product [Euphydryas editha]